MKFFPHHGPAPPLFPLRSHPPRTPSPSVYLFASANAERTQRGLPALRLGRHPLQSRSQPTARRWRSASPSPTKYSGEPELTQRGKLAGAKFSTIAENVAMAPTAVRIHTAWMDSPGHRENLLDPQVELRWHQRPATQRGTLCRTGLRPLRGGYVFRDEQESAVDNLVSQVANPHHRPARLMPARPASWPQASPAPVPRTSSCASLPATSHDCPTSSKANSRPANSTRLPSVPAPGKKQGDFTAFKPRRSALPIKPVKPLKRCE